MREKIYQAEKEIIVSLRNIFSFVVISMLINPVFLLVLKINWGKTKHLEADPGIQAEKVPHQNMIKI